MKNKPTKEVRDTAEEIYDKIVYGDRYSNRSEFIRMASKLIADARPEHSPDVEKLARVKADTDRLDFLQSCGTGYGDGWLVRMSTTGRGIRVHETTWEGAMPSIRDAIDYARIVKIDEEECSP